MFLKLTRKDNGKPIWIPAKAIRGLNEDSDGVGTMLLLGDVLVRVVTETPDAILAKISTTMV